MNTQLLRAGFVVCFLSLPCHAAPQATLFTFDETEAGAAAGDSVALWEDLDGDGTVEWVVGAPQQDSGAVDAGRVRVFSGATGLELFTFEGTVADGWLGSALANVGDLDGDGSEELAIGARGERVVRVYSGANQSLLWSHAEPARDWFGASLARAGDVDADGHQDVIVGASQDRSIVVLSGLDGSTVFSVNRPDLPTFGFSVASVGDTNGDGFDDVVAGAPYTTNGVYNEGAAAVMVGPTGATTFTHRPNGGQDRGQEFGYSVAPAGDVDGDGADDYAVGARYYGGLHYVEDNFVGVYSGATHAEIHRIEGGRDEWFGQSMAVIGDVDFDGHFDLAIGNPYGWEVVLYSPLRNEIIHTFETPEFELAGASVAGGRDVDGDGFLDVVQGTWVQTFSSLPGPGRAVVFTYGCPPDPAYPYCVTSPNSASATGARIGKLGSTSLAGPGMRLYATDCPTNTFGLFFHGTEEALAPSGFGNLCVGGMLLRLYPASPTGASGSPSFDVDLPSLGVQPGDTRFFQCWLRDSQGGTAGYNFSDGLRVTFCP